MLDFRKVFLGLAVAGLGLVGTASAQVPQCAASVSPFEGYVAVEGLTEMLPAIVINCGSTGPTTGTATYSGPVTFTLTSSVPFTNQTVANATNLDISAYDSTGAQPGGYVIPTSLSVANQATTITQSGPTTITVTFNTVSANVSTFIIAGLRVNASVAPVSSTITVQVTSSSVQMVSPNNAVNAAFVAKSLSAVAISSNVAATGAGTTVSSVSACGLAATTLSPLATVSFSSGFIDALKTTADVTNSATSNNPAPIDPNSVAAKQSTVIAVTFSNLNTAGVNYYVPATIGTAPLVLTATTGPNGTTAATPVNSGAANGLVAISQSGGSATAYYLVTTSAASEAVPAGAGGLILYQVVPSVTAVTSYSSTSPAVSIVVNGTAAPGYPQYTTTTPYTATESGTGNVGGLLNPCATTLLFPYVVNTGGFDTGVAIANASTGIPAGSSLVPSSANSGSCVVTFYGTGAATASVVYNTGTIATATDATFLVSAQAPGISGYAVAVCNFVGAHGYAFITDGFGGGGRGLSAAYLGIVLSAGGANILAQLPIATF